MHNFTTENTCTTTWDISTSGIPQVALLFLSSPQNRKTPYQMAMWKFLTFLTTMLNVNRFPFQNFDAHAVSMLVLSQAPDTAHHAIMQRSHMSTYAATPPQTWCLNPHTKSYVLLACETSLGSCTQRCAVSSHQPHRSSWVGAYKKNINKNTPVKSPSCFGGEKEGEEERQTWDLTGGGILYSLNLHSLIPFVAPNGAEGLYPLTS